MPYAYVQQINHVFDADHLHVYVTFRRQMQRSEIPQASPPVYDWYPLPTKWLLKADEVPVDILSSAWLDEFTLLLTSDAVASEPTGVTLEYAGPDEKLCYNWGKQIEPFGPRESFAGYPTTPALHNSTHENGGADEINVAGLSGLLADTQHSFVDRGDPYTWDFTAADITKDGAWHDLDLSSIVPLNSAAVLLRVYIKCSTVNIMLGFRKKGATHEINTDRLYTQVASVWNRSSLIVACDPDSVIQYVSDNAALFLQNIAIGGWWL